MFPALSPVTIRHIATCLGGMRRTRQEPRLATGYALGQASRFKLRASTVFQILHREPLNGRSSAVPTISVAMCIVIRLRHPSLFASRLGSMAARAAARRPCSSFFLFSFSLPSSRAALVRGYRPRDGSSAEADGEAFRRQMPRGRRRRRNISDASASRVSTRSTSRQGTSSLTSSSALLRRSSRIAERSSSAAAPESSTNNTPLVNGSSPTMAYVARRTQTNDNLGARAVEDMDRRSRRIRLDNPRTIRQNSNGRADGYDASGFVMDVIEQPPSSARLGQTLSPIQVRLRSRSHSAASMHEGHLVAFVSLTTRGSDGSDVPVGSEVLSGNGGSGLANSIQPADGDSRDVVGYASFSGLKIMQEGMYRIRVNLIKVDGGQGEVMQIVNSRAIVVGRS
ncbi:hypothetical protein IWX49DRAFT_276693 [Phyllosticta citricarpa]